jgi:hypothetical protein
LIQNSDLQCKLQFKNEISILTHISMKEDKVSSCI